MGVLKNYGLYKFWVIQGMRAQVELMTWLVNKWDVQDQCFIIGDHWLKIELEDIYFLTGLSKRGENISLFGVRQGGLPVASYKQEFCSGESEPKVNRIDIKTILWLDLKFISFTIIRLCGSVTPHVATKSQMHTAVECFRGTIFNWCEGVLANMKG